MPRNRSSWKTKIYFQCKHYRSITGGLHCEIGCTNTKMICDLDVVKTKAGCLTQQTACCWHTVSVAAALLSFLLSAHDLRATCKLFLLSCCWLKMTSCLIYLKRCGGSVGGGLYCIISRFCWLIEMMSASLLQLPFLKTLNGSQHP